MKLLGTVFVIFLVVWTSQADSMTKGNRRNRALIGDCGVVEKACIFRCSTCQFPRFSPCKLSPEIVRKFTRCNVKPSLCPRVPKI